MRRGLRVRTTATSRGTRRLDRNWDELLQELRVVQTGIQLLSGFLLTLPFTQVFDGLDDAQKALYLGLVLLAGIAVGLNLTPIMLHRRVFGDHVKDRVVADRAGAQPGRDRRRRPADRRHVGADLLGGGQLDGRARGRGGVGRRAGDAAGRRTPSARTALTGRRRPVAVRAAQLTRDRLGEGAGRQVLGAGEGEVAGHPTEGPVPVRLVDVEVKTPVATSRVPVTWAVSVPPSPVNMIGPVNDATVPSTPVIVKAAAVVPTSTPWTEMVAVVCPPPRSWPTPVASTGRQRTWPRAMVPVCGGGGWWRERERGGQADEQGQDETA